jgi:hypothetical protein
MELEANENRPKRTIFKSVPMSPSTPTISTSSFSPKHVPKFHGLRNQQLEGSNDEFANKETYEAPLF